MGVYAYTAVDGADEVRRGEITAENARAARDQLRAQGLTIDAISSSASSVSRSWLIPLRRARNAAAVAESIHELAILVGVGIPLTEAMDTVARQHSGALRTSLLNLRERVAAGLGLADAMSEQPETYDELCIHMIEVGENAGNLDTVLRQLATFKSQSLELKDRVLSALLYPAIVLCATIGVTLFLMTVVVPMLLTNLIEAGRPLPWPTMFLKTLSDLLLVHGGWVGLGIGSMVLVFVLLGRTRIGRRMTARALLKVPVAGEMSRKQMLARVSMVIAVLMRSGIVLLKAFEIAGRTTGNILAREALEQCRTDLAAGRELGAALERTQFFPPLVVQIFAVGQQTGQLEEMLERLAADYDRQVANSSARLTAALEPVLILILAVCVGFILYATILPILEAGNVL